MRQMKPEDLENLTFEQLKQLLTIPTYEIAQLGAQVVVEYQQRELGKIGLGLADILVKIPKKGKSLLELMADPNLRYYTHFMKDGIEKTLIPMKLVKETESKYSPTESAYGAIYTVIINQEYINVSR